MCKKPRQTSLSRLFVTLHSRIQKSTTLSVMEAQCLVVFSKSEAPPPCGALLKAVATGHMKRSALGKEMGETMYDGRKQQYARSMGGTWDCWLWAEGGELRTLAHFCVYKLLLL
jgi:hypothetical protein